MCVLLTNRDTRPHAASILRQQADWPASFWEQLPVLLNHNDLSLRETVIALLGTQQAWPPAVWTQWPDWYAEQPTYLKQLALHLLRSQPTWPEAVITLVKAEAARESWRQETQTAVKILGQVAEHNY